MACTSARCVKYKHDCNKCFGLSAGTVYEELWRGRDLEIANLWQRSIFLAVFMLAVASAYGTVLMKIAFPDKQPTNDLWTAVSKTQQEILIGLTFLGSTFSLLWCMMSKGSKYWVERYEGGIDYFVDGFTYAGEMRDFDYGLPYHGHLPPLPKEKVNDNPLSALAGKYSVSKVNITIGIVSLFAWSILGILHIGKYIETVWKIENIVYCKILSSIFFISALTIIFFILKNLCRSKDSNE